MLGSRNISEGKIPQIVVSQSQFRANPQRVMDAMFILNEELKSMPLHARSDAPRIFNRNGIELIVEAPRVPDSNAGRDVSPPRASPCSLEVYNDIDIITWHNHGGCRILTAMSLYALYGFAFKNSTSIVLGSIYLLSGWVSLGLQNCFGLVRHLHRACRGDEGHKNILKAFYLIGFALWLLPYFFVVENKNIYHEIIHYMVSRDYTVLYFIGFAAISFAMGFVIIIPPLMMNKIIVSVTESSSPNDRLGRRLDPQNTSVVRSAELLGRDARMPAEQIQLPQRNNPLVVEATPV